MVASATVTVLCFSEDKGIRSSHDSTELSDSEIITLACGVLFFVAFFLALYVEVKARINVYRLFLKFVYLNQQWYFDEYEEKSNGVVSVWCWNREVFVQENWDQCLQTNCWKEAGRLFIQNYCFHSVRRHFSNITKSCLLWMFNRSNQIPQFCLLVSQA